MEKEKISKIAAILIFTIMFIISAQIAFPFTGSGGGYTLRTAVMSATGGNATDGNYNLKFTSETASIANDSITGNYNASVGYIHTLESQLPALVVTVYALEANRSSWGLWLTNSKGDYNFSFVAPSSTGFYIIKINGTWSESIPGESLTILDVGNTQIVNLAAGGQFIVQNASGGNLAIFDSYGNADIKGTLTQNAEPTADANDFVIQNSTGGLNLVITNPEGNMKIKNSLTQNQGTLSPTLNSFIIQNSTGATLAYSNSTGGLFLVGPLTESVHFS
jgi:hypothetical protein